MSFPIVRYELKKLFKSKIIRYYLLAALIICLKVLIDTQRDMSMRVFTLPEGVISVLVSPIVIIWFLVPFSLYFMTNIFFDFELNNYIKIRSVSKTKWFLQKVAALFFYNCILIGILVGISLIISLFAYKFSMNWGTLDAETLAKLDKRLLKTVTNYVFPYRAYYSPVKVIIISFTILCGGLTTVGVAMGILSLRLNSSRAGLIIGYLYLLFSFKHTFFFGKDVAFVKYLAFDAFMLFENHNFDGLQKYFFTIKTTVILLPIIFAVVLLIGVLMNKNKDISLGN